MLLELVTMRVMRVIGCCELEGDWLVSVLTLDAEPGGLASQAVLTVFNAGDGRSTSTALGHPGIGLFRSGACDQFTVSLVSLFICKNIGINT